MELSKSIQTKLGIQKHVTQEELMYVVTPPGIFS
ncbi:unnamed protein product [Rhodiola kirilowii]